MKKRFALLLVLPAAILPQANVNWPQPCQADTPSDVYERRQSINKELSTSTISVSRTAQNFGPQNCLGLASLLPSMPTLLNPLQPRPVITISRPVQLNSPKDKSNLNNAPFVAPVRAAASTKSKSDPTILSKQSNTQGTTPTNNNTKRATKKPTVRLTSGATARATTSSITRSTKGSNTSLASAVLAGESIEDEVKYVSLTFDDGPSPVYTPRVLAILKREGIHATFCLIGREAKKHPDIVQLIAADGNKIADHSMNHDEHLDKRSDKKFKTEILSTKTLIESIVPGVPVDYYRAPAGNISRRQRKLLKKWGMKSLGWSVDTKDWQKPGVDEILATVKRQLHPGGVILMHDSGGDRSETLDALEKVIPQLKKDGYQFVFPGCNSAKVSPNSPPNVGPYSPPNVGSNSPPNVATNSPPSVGPNSLPNVGQNSPPNSPSGGPHAIFMAHL